MDKPLNKIDYPLWYMKLRGWYRLKYGVCPLCNSSPPWDECFVCSGTYTYGKMTEKSLGEYENPTQIEQRIKGWRFLYDTWLVVSYGPQS